MTPQEKAKELVFKFDDTMEFSTTQRLAKQCALIAVDEILDCTKNGLGLTKYSKEYWQEVKQEVKQEIEKL